MFSVFVGWISVGFYTAENKHDNGKSPCSIGNTSSFMVVFPLSCLVFGGFTMDF